MELLISGLYIRGTGSSQGEKRRHPFQFSLRVSPELVILLDDFYVEVEISA